jgi:hypothetical protein
VRHRVPSHFNWPLTICKAGTTNQNLKKAEQEGSVASNVQRRNENHTFTMFGTEGAKRIKNTILE